MFLQEHFSILHKLPDQSTHAKRRNVPAGTLRALPLPHLPRLNAPRKDCDARRAHHPVGRPEPSTDPAKTVNVFRQEHFANGRLVSPDGLTRSGGREASTRVFLQEHISILQRPIHPASGLPYTARCRKRSCRNITDVFAQNFASRVTFCVAFELEMDVCSRIAQASPKN